MTVFNCLKAATVVAAASTLMALPIANADSGERNEKQRRGPPQEAFDACAGSSQGSACSFSGRRGQMQGTCLIPPRSEEVLVCAPERGDRGQRGQRDEQVQ